MKKTISFIAILVAISITSMAQEKKAWKEMEAFHEVMSKTFHPAEEGKFEPIKARSAEMVEKAIAWKNSKAPEGFNQQAVQKNLVKLVKGAKKVNKTVQKNASDADLKEQLTELHTVFHEITEKCEHE
ncbi:MAG: hypothetical protein IPP43_07250 [Chitinophagaceae bacterium]|nr:hypothetical protein [Chitinophagaceae bacterium]MBK9568636.1 hypothetical protein [Chitinophagaceae bacterium]MBL0130934.1 hypothetical protein [Chitinophagaceae bacterium]MBL0272764.1 hypothetical protein [Chitinophagaceae bacterium]